MAEEAKIEEKPNETEPNQVITLDEVTMEKGAIDFHNQDGVVSGNVYRGAVLRGRANLSIEGEVLGVPETRSVIEVGGDVLVDHSVTGAKILGRNIVIAGDVTDCQIQAEGHVEIHGQLLRSQLNVGSRAGLIRALNHKRLEVKSIEQKISELTVQTSSAARKFVRDYPQVDLKMGNILVPLKRDLRVKLQQFYTAVGTDDSAKIDKALEEFYLRVVVGMLTRNNKEYISRNPSRHKIFLKLIEELRLHILKIRDIDKREEQRRALLKEGDALLRQLKNSDPEPYVRVGGVVHEGVTVTLVRLKGFQESPSGTIDIDRVMIEGRVVRSEEEEDGTDKEAEGGVIVVVTGPGGAKSTITPPNGVLENGNFTAWEDDLLWQTG